jgi:hypothetical protein
MYCDLFNIVYICVFHFINIFIVCNRFENIYIFSKTLYVIFETSVTVIDNTYNNEQSLIIINHLYIEPMVALIRSEYDIHYTKEVVL